MSDDNNRMTSDQKMLFTVLSGTIKSFSSNTEMTELEILVVIRLLWRESWVEYPGTESTAEIDQLASKLQKGTQQ